MTDAPFQKTFGDRTVALGSVAADAFERASQGNANAMGELYGMAAALIAAGLPLPEPVATMISQRLSEISKVLTSSSVKDIRAALPAAVAPNPRVVRDVGRKKHAQNMLLQVAEAAADLCELHPERGYKKRLVVSLASQYGYAVASVERAMTQIRTERRQACKQG